VRSAIKTNPGIPFSRFASARFQAKYLLLKVVFIWHDVKSPRLQLFAYEMVYSFCQFTRRPLRPLRRFSIDHVSTIFGQFSIRPGTMDAACVSPAFERQDLDHLLTRLGDYLRSGRSVLFLDLGADVGTYAVSVGNRLRQLGPLQIVAFEPSASSFQLVEKNVLENDLSGIVEARPLAVGDGSVTSATLRFDPEHPGSSGLENSYGQGTQEEAVAVSSLDAQIDLDSTLDIVAMKLDVEGMEIPVLQGATALLQAARETLLLVEDCIDHEIAAYLQHTGWTLEQKLTPYNSFWIYRPAPATDAT
jgi:FkbM family methyltransferase